MGAFPLFEDNLVALRDIFSEMPATVRSMMVKGFGLLAGLPQDKLISLAEEISKTVASASDTDVTKFAERIETDEESASAIFTATQCLWLSPPQEKIRQIFL